MNKKRILGEAFCALMLLVGGVYLAFIIDSMIQLPGPTPISVVSSSQVAHYPTSMLDGKPMAPSSIHRAHGTILGYGEDFRRDDGVIVKLFFTGGTSPDSLHAGMRGKIEVSVPSFDDEDNDGTYYFRSWTPDK